MCYVTAHNMLRSNCRNKLSFYLMLYLRYIGCCRGMCFDDVILAPICVISCKDLIHQFECMSV